MSKKKTTKKSEGLGDSVEKVLKATKVDKVAKWILGEDCGCEERKSILNKMFPYNKPNCLTEGEYKTLDKFFSELNGQVSPIKQRELRTVYNRVFNKKSTPTSCGSCLRDMIEKLNKVYEEYKSEKK